MYVYEVYALRSDGKTRAKTIKRKNPISDDRCEKIGGNWADYLAHTTNYNYVLWGCNFIKEC